MLLWNSLWEQERERQPHRQTECCLAWTPCHLRQSLPSLVPIVKLGVEGQLDKVTPESPAALKSKDLVTKPCDVAMMIILFKDQSQEARQREKTRSYRVLVDSRAEGHPAQGSSHPTHPDLLEGPWRKGLEMRKGWLLLDSHPRSEPLHQFPSVQWGHLRGAPDTWVLGTRKGGRSLLGSCPGKGGMVGLLGCVESWPHNWAQIIPLLLSGGQGLQGVCLRIKGSFSKNGAGAEREGGCRAAKVSSLEGKTLRAGLR